MLMLKNQLCKTILLFLAITNIFCGHILAMDRALVRDQKNSKGQDSDVILPPLSTHQFKQQFVPLSPISANTFPIMFDHPHEKLIINYQSGGNCIAQLVHFDNMMRFESCDTNKYNFLLQSALKTNVLTVATQGSFTFQKPVETQRASFTCKSVEFLDKFLSKKDLALDVTYCDNSSDVTCADMFFRGGQFNALSGSTLNIQNTAALLPTQGLFNEGMISCGENALINAPSFENWGTLKARNLRLDGGQILNEGSVNIEDSFLGACETFDHRGKMDVRNDCIFEKIGKLATTRSSSWKVGGDWKAHIEHLNLEGNSVVGNLALFGIGSHAILSGHFDAPVLYIDSKGLITCNFTAKLLATHYVGLKAKGWVQFEGDVFKTFLQKNASEKALSKLEALLEMFPKGVFLHSEQSGIKKSGKIIEKNGTVSLEAKKGLTHTGLTEAGFGLNSLLSMTSKSLSLEKESVLRSLNACFSAQDFIDQFGAVDIKQQLMMEALKVVNGGSLQAGTLCAKGDTISTTKSSHIVVENGSFDAQEKIVNAGTLIVSGQLSMNSEDITLETTSHVTAKNAQLKAVEILDNQGKLSVSEALLARAKFVENSGVITAQTINIKADRLWWNKSAGTVSAEDGLTIDALASMNTLGLMQANNLTINAGVDLNLLGIYRAKNTNFNALIGLNAGIAIPQCDSLDELITYDNAWKIGEGLLNKYTPTVGIVYVLGKNIVGVYQQKSILHQGKKLYDQAKNIYEQEDAGISDLIFLVCEAKNLTTSAIQLGKTVQQGYQLARPQNENINSSEVQNESPAPDFVNSEPVEEGNVDTEKLQSQPINWANIACQATTNLVSVLGPQMSRDMIVNLNCGALLGVNGNSRSICNINSGVSAFANKHTIDTDYGANVGILAASDLNVQATKTYNSPGMVAGINASITAQDLHVDGKVGAVNARLIAQNSLEQRGAAYVKQQLVMQAQDVVLDKNSHVSAKAAQIKSAKPLASQGCLDVSEHLVMDAPEIMYSNSVQAGNLFAKANNISFTESSHTSVINASLEVEEKISNAGSLTASEHLNMKAQDVVLDKNSHTSTKNAFFKSDNSLGNQGHLSVPGQFVVETSDMVSSGSLQAGNMIAKVSNNILFTGSSQTSITNGSLEAQGKITNAGVLTASEQLRMKAQNIKADKGSHTSAKTAILKADEKIDNQGDLCASDSLSAHAKYVENSGTIKAKDAHIKADGWWLNKASNWRWDISKDFWNSFRWNKSKGCLDGFWWEDAKGVVDVEGFLVIDALFALNECSGDKNENGGLIQARNLTINAGMDCNYSSRRATNTNINAILAFNFGFEWSQFDLRRDLLTKEMALALGVRVVSYYSPPVGLAYVLGKNLIWDVYHKQSVFHKGIKIYDASKKLYANNDAVITDWIPLVCEAKDVGLSTLQVVNAGVGLGKTVYQRNRTVDSNAPETVETDTEKSKENNVNILETGNTENNTNSLETGNNDTNKGVDTFSINWKDTAFQATSIVASTFGPQMNRDVLVDLNCGALLGINGSSRGIYNFNTGASLFANSYNVNTCYGHNGGLLAATELSVQAAKTYSSAGVVAGINTSMSAGDLNLNTYVTVANNLNLNARNKANIDADVSGRNIHINAKEVELKKENVINARGGTARIVADTITNESVIKGNAVCMQAKVISLQDGSDIRTQGGDNVVAIKAEECLETKAGSTINGGVVAIDALSFQGDVGNTITSTNQTYIKTARVDNQGAVKGTLTLDFTGDSDQLKGIGTVNDLRYYGTLENGLADTLAAGKSDLVNVTQSGSVTLFAGNQDVHLKEEHGIAHTLCVQTKGSIQCDKDLLSSKSIWLQAEGDIHHASVKSKEITGLIGQNISSEGHVTREYSGENYTDTCTTSKVSGNQVIIKTAGNLQYKGTHVHSGIGGTQLFVGNRLIADACEVEEYTKSEESDSKWLKTTTTTTEDKTIMSIPCAFTSDGATTGYVKNVAELHGTIVASKNGTSIEATIEDVPTYNTHAHREETKQTGYYNGTITNELCSQSRNSITFNDESPTIISSDNPVSMHLAGNTPSITINAPQVEVLVAKTTTHATRSKDGVYVGLWDRKVCEPSLDVTYGPSYSGIINANAQDFYIEEIKGHAPIIINTADENTHITCSLVEDLHQHQKQSFNRPTPVAMALIALSLSIALQGFGSSLGAGLAAKMQIESAVFSAMTSQATCGAINGLCMEAFTTLCDCNGDLKKAAKEFASKKTIRTIAVAAFTAAVTGGADKLLDKAIPSLSQATTLGERLAYTAPRELIKGGIRAGGDIAQGKKPKEVVKNRLKSSAANTIGIACSSHIGKAYGDKKIGPVTHKILHSGVGALQGAILDGESGAIAGAVGAGVAETIADITCPKQPSLDDIHGLEAALGRRLTQDEFTAEWNKQLAQYLKQTHSVADASKMIAATVVGFVNQDMDVAYNTATNAIDNNFFAFVHYGIWGATTAYALYKVPQIYEEKGIEEALQCLGVEVGWAGLDLLMCRSTEKIVFAVGGKIYPSASAAINVVLDKTPGLKHALGNFAKTLIEAGENFAKTGFGQKAVRVGKYAWQKETQICIAEDKLISNVGNKFIDKVGSKIVDKVGKCVKLSLPEDLVDHVVPKNVLDTVEKQLVEKATQEGTKQLALSVPDKLLSLPVPVASKVIKEASGKIKNFPSFEVVKKHIFSDNHKAKGIMELGPTQEAINDKFIQIIKEADVRNLLKEGPNNIITKINGKDVTIRAFIKNDEVISYNGFMKFSDRRVDNKIYL